MNTNILFRKILRDEIRLVKDYPPAEWQLNLSSVYEFHYYEDYFYPLVAMADNVIAGTGIVILNGDAAWLGTIIVREEFRKKGIGRRLTENLIQWAKTNGAEKIILIASELGFPVYKKAGFETGSFYKVFKNGNLPVDISKNIFKTGADDLNEILAIDRIASGEERKRIIERVYRNGYKYFIDNEIKGYYLPDFGKGLIIANDKNAGVELLKLKYSIEKSNITVPESNKDAIDFLIKNNFTESSQLPRMFLGHETEWKPEMVYARGCGYMG